MLTDTQRAALAPFAGMLDSMTDEALAAAAEVPVEAAAAFRAESVAPAADPAPAEKPRRGKKAEAAAPADVVAASVAELEPVEDVPCPKWVKVIGRFRATGWPALRRPPAFGDLYTGADAAFLWERHRAHVVPVE